MMINISVYQYISKQEQKLCLERELSLLIECDMIRFFNLLFPQKFIKLYSINHILVYLNESEKKLENIFPLAF